MACCKCCCGNETCAEGQQGKCCCGGSSGTCCGTGQYCCGGACSSEPCDGCICPCDERGAGYSYAYTAINGCEMCCPPGSSWDGEVCVDENNNTVADDSYEGWQLCDGVCFRIEEECPP